MIGTNTQPNLPYVWDLVAAINQEARNMQEQEYHYGDMTMVRPKCVQEAIEARRLSNRVAITEHHPAARHYIALYNGLTDAEIELVVEAVPTLNWI